LVSAHIKRPAEKLMMEFSLVRFEFDSLHAAGDNNVSSVGKFFAQSG